jgi:arabinose-5-phosphate isomerase
VERKELMDHVSKAKTVFETEIEALNAIMGRLDDSFNQSVDRIIEAVKGKSKVVVAGIGKSGNIGIKIAATLTSTGTLSVVLNSVDALHGDLGVVADGDVVLALSYSGESTELIDLLPALKRFSITLIAVTGNSKSALATASDLCLDVSVPREACPFNLAPTSSAAGMLVMGDALAMSILEARGFKEEDFAKIHPSGSIGRSLLLRISDIMRRGDRNPVGEQGLPVKEALLIMTRSKSGSVAVIDSSGKLTGIFTDGDFRRQIALNSDVLNASLESVMTRDPTTIGEKALAVEALRIFNERSIDDLIVVNETGEPVGLVDSQDLPKLKIV